MGGSLGLWSQGEGGVEVCYGVGKHIMLAQLRIVAK
jgi:hypothetical protein